MGLLGLLVTATTGRPTESQENGLRDGDVVPGAYVVEFSGDEGHESFYETLRSEGLDVDHRMDLRHELFNGASFNIRNHESPSVSELAL